MLHAYWRYRGTVSPGLSRNIALSFPIRRRVPTAKRRGHATGISSSAQRPWRPIVGQPLGNYAVVGCLDYRGTFNVGADEIVALLRARGAVLDIFEAAVVGDTERLGALIAEADRVNAYSAEGWTPLHLACFFGRTSTAHLLLDHHADVRAFSTDTTMRNTPLHAAIAGKRDHALITRLLERGADVNAVAGAGITPLHLAASRGDVPLIEVLLA